MIKRPLRLRSIPGSYATAVLICMVIVACWIDPLRSISVMDLAPLLVGLTLYALIGRWTKADQMIMWVWRGLMMYGLALCFLTPLGMLEANHVLFHHWPQLAILRMRLPDTFNANIVAGSLILILPFAASTMFPFRDTPGRRLSFVASGAVCLMLLGLLLLTQSRGAMLAAALGLLCLIILRLPRAWLAATTLAAAAGIALVNGWGSSYVGAWLSGDSVQGLAGRLDIWVRALDLIRSAPITGIGFGTFEIAVQKLYPLHAVPSGTVPHAHQLFLQIALDVGLPGLIAFLALVITALYQLGIAHHMQREHHLRGRIPALTQATIAAIVGMCMHGLLDCAVWGNKGAFLPWIILAISPLLLRATLKMAGSHS